MPDGETLNQQTTSTDEQLPIRTYLKWEAPIARARAQGRRTQDAELGRQFGVDRRRDQQAAAEVAAGAGRYLCQADAVAEDPGRAPSRAAALPRLRQRADRGLHAARRRPLLRRGRGDHGRHGPFRGRSVMVIGHEKGTDTESRIRHNFGMARPEGYRKAVRLMELAERFDMPVITLIDTRRRLSRHRRRGARPGRGHRPLDRRAASRSACRSSSVVIGEGGSGGAVAIATANRILMLEHAIYTVASPEAAASILWRDERPRHRRRDQHEDHRPGSAQLKRHRRHHPRAGRRRPPRPGRR